jgi:hypothetical protein
MYRLSRSKHDVQRIFSEPSLKLLKDTEALDQYIIRHPELR